MKTNPRITAFLFVIAFFLPPAFFCAQTPETGYSNSESIRLNKPVQTSSNLSVITPTGLIALDGNCSE